MSPFDEKWLGVALSISQFAQCQHTKVGAIVVRDNQLLGVGSNGMTKMPGCFSGFCPRGRLKPEDVPRGPGNLFLEHPEAPCLALHAEEDAILDSERGKLPGATLYVTRRPCKACARLIELVGIRKVVVPE